MASTTSRTRAALYALALGGTAIGTGEFVPMGLLPNISRSFHVGVATGGWVITAYALGVIVGAPALSVLAARLPRRAVLIGLMATVAVTGLLSAAAPSLGVLIAARFLAGLPHGAYFGAGSLAAASLVAPERRAWAITRALAGLTIANLACVPLTTWLGDRVGWRIAYLLVSGLAAVCVIALLALVPRLAPARAGRALGELRALRNPHVLLTLAVASVGLGGMFAVYSYISPILTRRAGLPEAVVPFVLAVWGAGMLAGGLVGGRVMDRWPTRGLFAVLGLFALCEAAFTQLSLDPITVVVGVFFIAAGFALVPGLQARLMRVAGDAQNLAAALNHAAFNVANALGAAAGGIALSRTGSLAAPAWVGVAMAGCGLVALTAAVAAARIADRPAGDTRLQAARALAATPTRRLRAAHRPLRRPSHERHRMISTSTSILRPPRPADGTLTDPDPWRRRARRQAAGIAIERRGPLRHVVIGPEGVHGGFRTRAAAERAAHAIADSD